MKKIIMLALTLLSAATFAEPTIFGMELGKMTEKEIKAMYQVKQLETNEYCDGNTYLVPVNEIRFKGLKEVTAIFNKDGYLVAVLNRLPKRNFDSLNNTFAKSYTLTGTDNPFVGNKSATYRVEETEIRINAQHDSAYMSLDYINDEIAAAFTLPDTRQKTNNN